MRRRKERFLIFLLLLCSASCINKNEVWLDKRNFEAEVEQQQNLIFTFDRDLVVDSVLNKWDTTQYINISPTVRGQFKWNTRSELMFSPIVGFQPSTDYKATITTQILRFTKGNYSIPKENSIQFHTPYVKFLTADGYWGMSSKISNAAELSISLNFNNEVDPVLLSSLLHINLAKQPAAFAIITTTVSKTIIISIDNLDRTQISNMPVQIKIDKGLKCAGSDFKTKEGQELSMVIPSPDKLEITQAVGEYSGTETIIHVFTNQAVEKSEVGKFIVIEPKVDIVIQNISDGFNIKGAFKEGLSYQLTISKELKGALGGKMENDFTQLIPFGTLEPSISFISKKGVYLSSNIAKNIAINIINIPRIQVKVRKIYENNILHYISTNRGRNYEYRDEEGGEMEDYGYQYNDYNIDLYSSVVFDKYYETRDLPKVNGAQLLNMSFDEQNSFKGIYLVDVTSSNSLYKHDSKLISISDIGLITKKTDDEIYIFANSLKTAKPISGVSVSFISSNNQSLYTTSTDGDGVATFKNINTKAPDFHVAMITAKIGSDFNYLLLSDSRVNDSRFEVGGRRPNQTGCIAFLYGDRNIYRPGENIYLNTIVLDEKWSSIGEVPIKIKLILPNGKEFKSIRGTLNKQGAFSTAFALPVSAATGTYIAEVYSSNDVLLESKDISVEEFIPDRIDVKLELNKQDYISNDSIIASLKAINLFGPPAADRKYEVELSLSYKYFSAKKFPGYTFSINKLNSNTFSKILREGKTNAAGMAKETFNIGQIYKGIGKLEGKIYSTVIDETGRPVNRLKRFDIYTQDVFYGIKMSDSYVNAHENVAIPLISVDKNGEIHPSTAQVKIIRHDWYSVIEKTSSGEFHYVSHENDRTMLDQQVSIGPNGYILNYFPRESGEFEVRISDPGNEHYVAASFYSYGYGYTQNTSFSVNTEGEVDIKFDKEKYNPGDNANILFTTPFGGTLLVTVECDKLLEYYYLQTDKKTAKLNLLVKDNYRPNVYITATLFRPLDDGAIPLTVGHGFAPMIVNAEKNKMPLTILAVPQSRSKTKQTIRIKTRPSENVELTVAVVDEGILQLKNYKTPDPYAFFFQKKALNVSTHDLYPVILPDINLKKHSSTGGDGYDLEKRVNPLTNKRVKLVAFWSGILKTNSAGEADYTIDIPQFSGDLRIMACAYKDKAFGSSEAHMKVADPVVISAAIPRFLSPRDTLIMPVTFSNTTKKSTQLTANISVTGALNIIGSSEKSVTLNAGSEQKIEFKIISMPTIGNGSITVNAKAFGELFTDKTEITIRPSTSLLKVNDAGMIPGNSSRSISLKTDFIPSTITAKLIISQNPMVQFSNQLNYLLGYPNGCLEQTTSKAFPQIYFSELVQNVKNARYTPEEPHYYVQEAIRKIETMQLYNGAFSYWPSGLYENWWAAAYADHFLMEAKKAGYEVNENILDRCISYLGQKIKAHETETYYYWDDSNILRSKTFAKKENAYSLYILALYGKPDISSMNYYKSNTEMLTLDSRYLLACTYLAIGDRKNFDELLPKVFEGERSQRCSGGSFYSYIRDEAIVLNALIENDPDNSQIGVMVRHLSQQLNKDRYLNTQECAFAFLALGKFMKHQNEVKVTADIRVDNKTVATFDGKEIILTKGIAGKSVVVNVKGSGNIYYFLEEEGLNAKGEYKEEDSYLKVRKFFFDRFGQPISIREIKQGDLIAIKISVQNTEHSKVENIVVTDMLPAGFEIENPRIGEVPGMSWTKKESQPDYFDVRDDRINFYTSVGSETKDFYYLVRAVSPGNYNMGPVSADAMYNGEYHSYNGACVVKIVQ